MQHTYRIGLLYITTLAFRKTFWSQWSHKMIRTAESWFRPPLMYILSGAEHFLLFQSQQTSNVLGGKNPFNSRHTPIPTSSIFPTFNYYFLSKSLIFLALKRNPSLDAAPNIQCYISNLGHGIHKRTIWLKLQADQTYIN